ncbi:predicted protein [Nematostella vectensis]|uniref:Uncharacterized protein n=1 Tax=Nematostella vectensis TaxID=45351 RepID=A7S033_NEMVE|nr:predicted protein [Nematostella vectensis]|eukprot:XP_001635010.1 predicted protein [Nematostella vectensis]
MMEQQLQAPTNQARKASRRKTNKVRARFEAATLEAHNVLDTFENFVKTKTQGQIWSASAAIAITLVIFLTALYYDLDICAVAKANGVGQNITPVSITPDQITLDEELEDEVFFANGTTSSPKEKTPALAYRGGDGVKDGDAVGVGVRDGDDAGGGAFGARVGGDDGGGVLDEVGGVGVLDKVGGVGVLDEVGGVGVLDEVTRPRDQPQVIDCDVTFTPGPSYPFYDKLRKEHMIM